MGAPYAVPLTSATAGLHLIMLALELKPGDEVITTPMTFAATVSMIVVCGAKPVLADIEPGTLNLDAARIRERITRPDPRHRTGSFCRPVLRHGRHLCSCPGIRPGRNRRRCPRCRHRIQRPSDRLLRLHLHLLLPSHQEHHHRRRGHGVHPRRIAGRRDFAAEIPRHEPGGVETLLRPAAPPPTTSCFPASSTT